VDFFAQCSITNLSEIGRLNHYGIAMFLFFPTPKMIDEDGPTAQRNGYGNDPKGGRMDKLQSSAHIK